MITALEYFQKSVEVYEIGLHAEDPLSYASALSNLAALYTCFQPDYDKALKCYLKCLELRRSLGESHPEYAYTLNNIGLVYDKKGQYMQALGYLQSCESLLVAIHGPSHPLCATNLNNIAAVYSKMNDHDRALEYYHKCEHIQVTTLGDSHPKYADTLNDIAVVHCNQGEYRKALEYYQRCEQIVAKSLGETHSDYVHVLMNISLIHHRLSDLPQMKSYLARVDELIGSIKFNKTDSVNKRFKALKSLSISE
eukprot:TRINITY_DN12129_c0_g1_i2.p1 TRINITY_DN12129_c0_g1~~TRINITY_DN12129_c0_g1_i2.p1  ORF type:complete len:252 (-),score=38.75 TRINITY_DN12129_c0_g1_i2:124-879(-)